jgi:hypothetical protein
MIAAEPELGEVGELMILCDQLRRKVAVIVEDRLVLGVAVIKFAGLFRREEEILVDEGAGGHGRSVEQ